jgi:hypothetical protein
MIFKLNIVDSATAGWLANYGTVAATTSPRCFWLVVLSFLECEYYGYIN